MEIKIKSTTVKLEYSFLILLSFAVLYGYEYSIKLILFSLLHETGHLLALVILGVKPDLINFSFYGIGLKYQNNLSRIKEFFVLFCGPLVNLILYFVLNDEINFFLFLINIYPAFPLDGGRMIKIIFPRLSKVITIIFLLILIALSLILLIKYRIYSLLLIAAYLLAFNINYYFNRGFYEKVC